MVVVVSHLFLFLGDKFRGRCDSHESHLPLCGTIYFPTAPVNRSFIEILGRRGNSFADQKVDQMNNLLQIFCICICPVLQ